MLKTIAELNPNGRMDTSEKTAETIVWLSGSRVHG